VKELLAMVWKAIKPGERLPRPKTLSREAYVKTKKRIKQLKTSNSQLQEQLDNQTQLLERVVKDLAQLRRDVAHVLPEK
jgi:predicted RNase H-like nuclease (RuvC/YqgF family)